MACTSVVKLKRSKGVVVQDCDIYIGRQMNMGGWRLKNSIYANPFKIAKPNIPTALDATIAYWDWIHLPEQIEIKDTIHELKGKVLGCWCKKKSDDACHGDVLAYLADGVKSPSIEVILAREKKSLENKIQSKRVAVDEQTVSLKKTKNS